jgi:chromosome segregation ATPase
MSLLHQLTLSEEFPVPDQEIQDNSSATLIRNIVLAVAGVYIAFSLYMTYQLTDRISAVERKEAVAEATLNKELAATENELRAASDKLSQQVGLTKKDIAARSAQLTRQQKAAEARLAEEQQKQQQALGTVGGDVAGVKAELASTKTDIGSTRSDLEATKAKLERTIGDLGLQSGLIATTREDLETLKHKGDRNYYEFTLNKSKQPTPVSTVSLQLKKADRKKGKYTLNVMADDRTIEKKDRNVNEPLQFYTGRDRMLYELVVFAVDKDKVTGYISTPKNAPVAIAR